jgi:hypothetical protein
VAVKRVSHRHGYPPDKQERATALVIEQAEQLGLELTTLTARWGRHFTASQEPRYDLRSRGGGGGDGWSDRIHG